jgi:Flp pilus assembly protein TadD
MAYTHFRFGAALAILLLGSTALVGPAQAGWLFGESNKDAKAETGTQSVKAGTDVKPAETLDGSIRQAQLLRTDGNYSEAIRHLSQLMMVASDDQRVISEYGKTLAAMGRAQEAINFLTRAQQLQPGDWTVHSALGVAYDQLGKQTEAKQAYEQALAIRPGEASILSNYALSRMLANDPEGAQKLIARAEIAGGASDTKIARNIAMIRELAPKPAPDAEYAVTNAAPSPAPRTSVAATALPTPPTPARAAREPQRTAAIAPRPVQPAPFVDLPTPPVPVPAPAPVQNTMIEAQPQMAAARPAPQGVVMQRVPEDPLAGPVAVAIPRPPVATRAPRSLTPAPKSDVARAPAQATPAPVKAAAAPAAKSEPARKTAANAAEDLQARAEKVAKQMEADKGAQAKPAAPVKPTATAAAASKNPVPALRLSASAYYHPV